MVQVSRGSSPWSFLLREPSEGDDVARERERVSERERERERESIGTTYSMIVDLKKGSVGCICVDVDALSCFYTNEF